MTHHIFHIIFFEMHHLILSFDYFSVQQVVEGSGDKNIVLRMARSVGAEAMVTAVESSVRPRMGGKDTGALKVRILCKLS